MEESIETAENEQRLRDLQLDSLVQKAKSKSLELLANVPYNGDCLFSAVLSHIPTVAPDSASLRRMLVAYFQGTLCHQETKMLCDANENFLANLQIPFKDVQETLVVRGLAEMLGVHIYVFSVDVVNDDSSEEMHFSPHVTEHNAANDKKITSVCIGHIKDKHFVALQ